MDLQTKLEAILNETQGIFGVAIKHLQTGEEAYIREKELFQLASVFKLPILVTLFEQVEKGNVHLEQSVTLNKTDRVPGSGVLKELDSGVTVSIKDLAMLMIIVSDNYATDKLLSYVGIDNVNRYMKQLGLKNTFIKHSTWNLLSNCVGMDMALPTEEGYNEFNKRFNNGAFNNECHILQDNSQNNVSNPSEINQLLEKIANKELISPVACEGMLDILKKQQLRNRIPNILPEGTVTATKSGTVGYTINDVGIVYLPDSAGSFAITVLSKKISNRFDGENAISKLSRTAFDHFMNKS